MILENTSDKDEALLFTDDSFIDKADLKFFYRKWLSYCTGAQGVDTARNNLIQNREFSMTIKSEIDQDEIYLRWQNFKTIDQLKQEIVARTPHKFDIGAIYNIPISEKEITPIKFKPVQRELVFDIDMNDYDDIRTCCQEKTVCEKCWLYVTVAIRLIDTSLRQDFGFKHILWLYSGRRGVHCWVCDTKARLLPSEARTAIIDYLTLITGNENRKKKVNLKTPSNQNGAKSHPFIDRCFNICMQYFLQILENQQLFDHKSIHINKVLNHLSEDTKVHQTIQNWIQKTPDFTCLEFWDFLSNTLQNSSDRSHHTLFKEIVFAYSYPRLDINVSKDLGHLLKAPFCIHHSTGRLCIPIDISQNFNFNPKTVPTLTKIRNEYDNINQKDNNSNNVSMIPSSINKYIKYMDNFVDNLIEDIKKEQEEYNTMLQLINK
ncbi:DNA primase small subunit [Cryptosporidium ubiquitum]|uniref:DNA primase n=1 Tax=Cryptosporidium ubiquitum TaxID=857276 RepID=A0A1J4MDA9_9CRYT|nr:DNA primase small subunit [Cryptosporidium ubiquitum]OII72224.1 DNA primase small subunit [Cryptosporidium ubiquitum]